MSESGSSEDEFLQAFLTLDPISTPSNPHTNVHADPLVGQELNPEPGIPSYRQHKGKEYVKEYERKSYTNRSLPEELVARGVAAVSVDNESLSDSSMTDSYDGLDSSNEDGRSSSSSSSHCAASSLAGLSLDSGDTSRPVSPVGDDDRILEIYAEYRVESIPRLEHVASTIFEMEEQIVHAVDSNVVTIIQGQPGCGKSTQVPQMLLKAAATARVPCKIIVTQPRRIAAKTLARFVSKQRGWVLGDVVGYQVGLDKDNISENTLILYATPGVILRKMQGGGSSKFMEGITHIILDEVHERSKDLDFLMLLLRLHLSGAPSSFKLLLMSATMDSGVYEEYFGDERFLNDDGRRLDIPSILVPHKSFPVLKAWLDSLFVLGQVPNVDLDEPKLDPQMMDLCKRVLDMLEREACKRSTAASRQSAPFGGGREVVAFPQPKKAVLIFLPGFAEIQAMHEKLSKHAQENGWVLVMLHSRLMSSQEDRVFEDVEPGVRKIILATNIAESSVTFPDVEFVIDFGLTRRDFCDNVTNLTQLRLDWASQSEIRQRAGRAGRVANGRVYHLISKSLYELLPEHPKPEMERTPLPNLIVLAKTLSFKRGIKEVFAMAMTPPNEEDIERGVLLLKENGGMTLRTKGRLDPFEGKMTLLGEMINVLPLDSHLTRFILLGFCFGIIDDCIALGAILNYPDLFQHSFRQECQVYYAKMYWSCGSESDCIALLRVYKAWKAVSEPQKALFCADNHLDRKLMQEVLLREEEIRKILSHAGFIVPDGLAPKLSASEAALFLKVTMAGAFYPRYLLPTSKVEKDCVRDFMDHDPRNSVIFRSMPPNSELYADQIGRLLSDVSRNAKVAFYPNKCVVEFVPTGMEMYAKMGPEDLVTSKRDKCFRQFNGVHSAVQMAVRSRLARRGNSEIRVFNDSSAPLKSGVGAGLNVPSDVVPEYQWPAMSTEPLRVDVTHVSPTLRFWARRRVKIPGKARHLVEIISDLLNHDNRHLLSTLPVREVECGLFVVAPRLASPWDERLQRGKIVHVKPGRREVIVHFVDFGDSDSMHVVRLMRYDSSLLGDLGNCPAQAFPCELACIAPQPLAGREDMFSNDAFVAVENALKPAGRDGVRVRLFSVCFGVGRVFLERRVDRETWVNLNDHLVSRGYAVPRDEGCISTENREGWLRLLTLSPDRKARPVPDRFEPVSALEFDKYRSRAAGLETKTSVPATSVVKIRGPWSPFELGFMAACEGLKGRNVRIQCDSINAAAVDVSSGRRSSKLLVAEKMKLDGKGNSAIAYHTSLMHLSPGQKTLFCLMFAPFVEFRLTEDRRKITGLLCGLGYTRDEKGVVTPMFPDHDMEVVNDVEIFEDDISHANMIRDLINWILERHRGLKAKIPRAYQKILLRQTTLRRRVHDFLLLHRLPFKEEVAGFWRSDSYGVEYMSGQWGCSGSDETSTKSSSDSRSVYLLDELSIPTAYKNSDRRKSRSCFLAEELTRVARILIQLRKGHSKYTYLTQSRCRLCKVGDLRTFESWHAHLLSSGHRTSQAAAVAEARDLGIAGIDQLRLDDVPGDRRSVPTS